MKKLVLLLVAAGTTVFLPLVTLMAVVGIAGATAISSPGSKGGDLTLEAPVPARARPWIALTHAACPALPESWIAAVMAQESGFRPDAYADDSNGGTWGLFQTNASIWAGAYGAPWSADLNHNGVWDVKDPLIHAQVGGKYLCARLDGVRRIRAAHPTGRPARCRSWTR